MMLRILVFCLVSALAGCAKDAPLDVAANVDLSRFQGKWYEIARLPRITQTDCYGTTAFYTQAADGSLQLVNQCNVGATEGSLKTVTMTATVPDSTVPAKLALDVGGYVGDYWILEVGTDYDYAVIGHPSRAYLWILSRTATLDAETVSGIVDRAQGMDFETSQLQYTPQPPAGERSTSNVPEGPVPPAQGHGCSMVSGTASREWGPSMGLIAGLLACATQRRRKPVR